MTNGGTLIFVAIVEILNANLLRFQRYCTQHTYDG